MWRETAGDAGVLVNEDAVSIGKDQATVSLHASRPARIDVTRAIDALTSLDWLGLRVDGPVERENLRRVSIDLELPVVNGSASGPIRKAALIDIGMPQTTTAGVLLEVGWQSASFAPIFPVFAGQLRITPISLLLDGRYAPPFGRLGLLIDESVLHFVAHRTAEAFLARLASQLEG